MEQAALIVGYSSHSLSRNTKHNNSRIILVIVPNLSDPFFIDIIQGIEQTAAKQGYLVLVSNCRQQHRSESALGNLMTTKKIEGIVLLGSKSPFDISKKGQRNLPPIVMAIEFVPELELPTVHIDNLTAAFETIHYLHKLGHQKIACIAGPESIVFSHYRLQGYIQALHRNGLVAEKNYILRGDFSYETGNQAFATLMNLSHPPTAIFCHNDLVAIGAMQQARKLGVMIPQDVSIVGFDNLSLSQYCLPSLTTVAQPRYQIGQQAMLLLLGQLQGDSISTGSKLLDTELIVRESTSVPRCQLTISGLKR